MHASSQQSSLASTPTSPNFASGFARNASSSAQGSDTSRPGTPADSMLDAPSSMPFASYLKTWHDGQVSRWLQEHRCGAHSPMFASNDIRGDVLLELDNLTLKEMGITSVGDRVRILSAVKLLRQRCNSRLRASAATLSSLESGISPIGDRLDDLNGVEASPVHRNKRLESSRPPPLHLAYNARSELSRLERSGQSSAATPDSTKTTLLTPRATPQSTASTYRNQPLPPLPPAPRSQPPPPPPSAPLSNTRIRPLAIPPQSRVTPQTQTDVTTPVSVAWQGDYGLPARPNPGNLGGGKPGTPRATSPLPQTPLNVNKRNGTSSPVPTQLRPQHERAYSLPGSHLPTMSRSTQVSSSLHPYSTTPALQVLQPPQNSQQQLSPIAESFHGGLTPVSTISSAEYRVGRGPFSSSSPRPSTPSHRSIDDIRRKTIKFHLPEENTSRIVDVADCETGVRVLEKVLKKFAKIGGGSSNDLEVGIDEMSGGLSVEGWGLFLSTAQDDGHGNALSEAEILSVCHSELDHPVREYGLTLRRAIAGRQKRSKQLGNVFGEQLPDSLLPPNTGKSTRRASTVSILSGLGVPVIDLDAPPPSPTPELVVPSNVEKSGKHPRSAQFVGRPPSEMITNNLEDYFPFTEKKLLARTARHSMMRQRRESNRDSMVFNLGLNRRDSQQPSSRFSTSSVGSAPRTSTSEKRFSISSPSLIAVSGTSSEHVARPTVSVQLEDGESTVVHTDEEKQSDTASLASSARSGKGSNHLLPPINLEAESFSESFDSLHGMSDPSTRFKRLSELRSKRDNSDAASMLTVDEITAEVESRRASFMSSADDSGLRKRNSVVFPVSAPSDQQVPQEEEMLDDLTEGETLAQDYDEDENPIGDGENSKAVDLDLVVEGEEDEDEEDEDAPSKAITSSGARAIKWIKGALIGKGSFGSVYLAMDAQRGLLMAVKQVEIPNASAMNAERKKSMLAALEREIELLKELQHENIVQYLDSSVDHEYLNIFLEYVPGGSVTALLRNYGAFEEPLVRNFVRQILQGLTYLHGRDIIHRDIKGANILVDNKSCVKISDFGISKKQVEDTLLGSHKAHRPSLQGSVFWMAPEVVKQTSYTSKADIWSLGCLCVEMLTGEHPWGKLNQMQALFKIGSSAKPVIPSDISPEAVDFMERTFDLDYQARPSAADLLNHPWIVDDAANPAAPNNKSLKSSINPPIVTVNG